MNSYESIESFRENKRAISLMNPALSMMEERKRQVKAVRDGYQSNKMFDHTIQDVMRVMDHKIDKRIRNAKDAMLRSKKEEDEKAAEEAAAATGQDGKSKAAAGQSSLITLPENQTNELISIVDSHADASKQAEIMSLMDEKKLAESLL